MFVDREGLRQGFLIMPCNCPDALAGEESFEPTLNRSFLNGTSCYSWIPLAKSAHLLWHLWVRKDLLGPVGTMRLPDLAAC